MEFLCKDLRDDQHDKQAEEQGGAGEIAPVERHGDGVAAGLAQRRRGDLDDPEAKGNFGDLAQSVSCMGFRPTFLAKIVLPGCRYLFLL
jgi:hypothetical protein